MALGGGGGNITRLCKETSRLKLVKRSKRPSAFLRIGSN